MCFKHEEDNCIVLEQEQLDFLQLQKSSVYWARAVGSACARGKTASLQNRGAESSERTVAVAPELPCSMGSGMLHCTCSVPHVTGIHAVTLIVRHLL